MKFILLTHQRELKKKTNTGSLIADVLGDQVEVIVWERVNPSAALLHTIARGSIALLYPSDDSTVVSKSDVHQSYVIIDGTWQEAQKIYNRSPYLHGLPTVKIQPSGPSVYHLRRNQKPGCLCTAECAIAVLRHKGFDHQAGDLQSRLTGFLDRAR